MEQAWFEMKEIHRRALGESVWVPLRSAQWLRRQGRPGTSGYLAEYFGAITLLVPVSNKDEAAKLQWGDLCHVSCPRGCVHKGNYIPAATFADLGFLTNAIHPVLVSNGNRITHAEWHLLQDFIVTLQLRKESDIWVRPTEDYVEAARLVHSDSDAPVLLEVRKEHLADYLCARGMGLHVVRYHLREEVVDNASSISWSPIPMHDESSGQRWEGNVLEIHEGGQPFGQSTTILELTSDEVDIGSDVPRIPHHPNDDAMRLEKRIVESTGRKLFRVCGELWRTDWLGPAQSSPRVRGDRIPATAYFVLDAQGNRESRDALLYSRQWLWFRPEIMTSLLERRGGLLEWFTRDTGQVICSGEHDIVFGVNSLGLVNVYAKDIAQLPDWLQGVWAGFNIAPDGGVSSELLAAQAEGKPADTQAPEVFLHHGLARVNRATSAKYGAAIIKLTKHVPEITMRCHRFRSTSQLGLFALAKDLYRVTSECLDRPVIQRLAKPFREGDASLKSLEALLATCSSADVAHAALGPLFHIYELRNKDAHLSGSESDSALKALCVDASAPFVRQGYEMIAACVSAIYEISRILET